MQEFKTGTTKFITLYPIAVTTVPESVLEELTANDVLHKRSLTG
jgi:hypothetical protein